MKAIGLSPIQTRQTGPATMRLLRHTFSLPIGKAHPLIGAFQGAIGIFWMGWELAGTSVGRGMTLLS